MTIHPESNNNNIPKDLHQEDKAGVKSNSINVSNHLLAKDERKKVVF